MQTWDHIVINPPHFYPYIILAYLLLHRVQLLGAACAAKCAPLATRAASLDVAKLLRRAALALETTPAERRLPQAPFAPLAAGPTYPPFDAYPTHALEAHKCDRSRLLSLQSAVVERRRTLAELQVRRACWCTHAGATWRSCLCATQPDAHGRARAGPRERAGGADKHGAA
jgi:hypothetical protein